MRRPDRIGLLLAAMLLAVGGGTARGASPAGAGSVTGLPLPRFVSLRADPVNLRVGPGLRYPIAWVIHRRALPVRIVREFKQWRAVRLPDGTAGWVHAALVTGRRTFAVRPGPSRHLRHRPAPDAPPVALLRPGVIGRIRACGASDGWCLVSVRGYDGYVRRQAMWGIASGEAVTG